MSENDKKASPGREAISRPADPWEIQTQRLSALFLAAVREALPQEEVCSVSIGYRYVDQTQAALEIQPGCFRVEIIRSGNGLLNSSF